MAPAAMLDDAQEGFAAFLEKRHPNFPQRPEIRSRRDHRGPSPARPLVRKNP